MQLISKQKTFPKLQSKKMTDSHIESVILSIGDFYFALTLIRISVIPAKRQTIRGIEILSASPNNAIAVVTIKTVGPTRASIELI